VLTPILVDHTGRDGSTLTMRLLATSPNVAIPGPYPYEKKYFAYLWRWSRLLERRDKSPGWSYLDLSSLTYESGKSLMGPPPWSSDLMNHPEDPMSKRMFEAAWSEFSRRAAEQVRVEHGDPDAGVRYYAEKHRDTRMIDLGELPPVRVLVLVRDPRDMFVSFHAFDAKRQSEGRAAFVGARPAPGESEDERIERFIDRERSRMRWIVEVEGSGEFPVFRYEDLVTDVWAQARRLEEWLSIDLDPDAAASDAELRRLHVSASTPEASVGRWRTELEPELADRFSNEFREELAALGYQVEAREPR
jgi:sulfotransferase family protein